jgi:hypothetical protein
MFFLKKKKNARCSCEKENKKKTEFQHNIFGRIRQMQIWYDIKKDLEEGGH